MNAGVGGGAAFLWGYVFHGGAARPVTDQSLAADLKVGDGWVWLHYPLSDQRARGFIEAMDQVPVAARRMMLEVEMRPQLQFLGDWVHGVLPDVERDLDGRATGAGRLQFAGASGC